MYRRRHSPHAHPRAISKKEIAHIPIVLVLREDFRIDSYRVYTTTQCHSQYRWRWLLCCSASWQYLKKKYVGEPSPCASPHFLTSVTVGPAITIGLPGCMATCQNGQSCQSVLASFWVPFFLYETGKWFLWRSTQILSKLLNSLFASNI